MARKGLSAWAEKGAGLLKRKSPAPFSAEALKIAGAYVAALLLCFLYLDWRMKLNANDFRVPFVYEGDGLLHQLWVKAMIDNGWYLHNDYLGMPFGMDVHDYPQSESLHLVLMKLISLCRSDYGFVFNCYGLLTFPLTVLTSLFVLRSFGFSLGTSVVASLLFAFLPYHFIRLGMHHYLAAYYLIPLTVMVALWTYLDHGVLYSLEGGETRKPALRLWRGKSVAGLAICFVVGCAGIYYAYFACFLLLVAGAAGAAIRRKLYPLSNGALLIGMTVLAILVNVAPNLLYICEHGPNGAAVRRVPAYAEYFGLKIAQLLLPVHQHRLDALADLRSEYDADAPLVNENRDSALGIVGAIGFSILVGRVLAAGIRRRQPGVGDAAAVLGLSAVLLATVGGFGSVFSVLGGSWIRAYARMCIYIAFLSFFVLVDAVEHGVLSRTHTRVGRWGYLLLLPAVLAFGLWDLTPRDAAERRPTGKYPDEWWYLTRAQCYEAYASDAAFVQALEKGMPPGAMIFQLPYIPFYENQDVNGAGAYDALRGYFHSHHLRWNYGGLDGRVGNAWNLQVVRLPLPEMLKALAFAGFSGVYVDRWGYADRGSDLEANLANQLGVQPIVSPNERLSFFSMLAFNDRLAAGLPPREWQSKREAVLTPVLAVCGKGFQSVVTLPEEGNKMIRGCGSPCELFLNNLAPHSRAVTLEMEIHSADPAPAELRMECPLFVRKLPLAGAGNAKVAVPLDVPPGTHRVLLTSSGRRVVTPGDPRHLVFQVINLTIKGEPFGDANGAPAAGPTGRWEGNLDAADKSLIAGWAMDRNRPTDPVGVEIYDGTELVAAVNADQFRPDLRDAGKGDGRHGFVLATPVSLKTGGPHAIRLKIAGTDVELVGSPKTVIPVPP